MVGYPNIAYTPTISRDISYTFLLVNFRVHIKKCRLLTQKELLLKYINPICAVPRALLLAQLLVNINLCSISYFEGY